MVGVLEVVPGKNGIFDVHVDGELVFTKSMLGRYPDPTTWRRCFATSSGSKPRPGSEPVRAPAIIRGRWRM